MLYLYIYFHIDNIHNLHIGHLMVMYDNGTTTHIHDCSPGLLTSTNCDMCMSYILKLLLL